MLAVAAILFTAIPTMTISSAAAVALPISLENAIKYANKYVIHNGGDNGNGYNTPAYANLSEYGDCANFVSQCLVQGGIKPDDKWKPDKNKSPDLTGKNPTPAWSVSFDPTGSDIQDYFISKVGAPINDPNDKDIDRGDIVVTKGTKYNYGHVGFCVDKDGDKPLVNAHTADVEQQAWGKTTGIQITRVIKTSKLFKVTVQLKANGGQNNDGKNSIMLYANMTVNNNLKYNLPIPTPTRKGYIFKGWFDKPKGGKEITSVGGKNTTYYAQWYATVTFDYGDKKITCKVTEGDQVGKLPTDTKRNWTLFKGWYTKDKGGTRINETQKVTKNVTYYARWWW